MVGVLGRILGVAVALVGCGGAHAVPVGNVSVEAPERLFARIETRATGRLLLTNTGTASVRVSVQVEPPFFAATDTVVIGVGASTHVGIFIRPDAYGVITGRAEVTGPDGAVDVALEVEVPADFDGDGFDDVGAGGPDCDDGDPDIHPNAADVCDRADNDCSGEADDDPTTHTVWYADADGDGHGDSNATRSACFSLPEEADDGDDCDDGDPERFPGAAERTDGADQDCDGWVDEHLYAPGSATLTEIFLGGGGVPPYLEVLLTSGFRVDLAAAQARDLVGNEVGSLPARMADDREVLVFCPTGFDVVVDRACDATLDPFPVDGIQLVARTDPGGPVIVLDRVDWSGFGATDAAALELSPDRLGANRNDGRASWCTSRWPLDAVFGTPGSVLAHCGAPE